MYPKHILIIRLSAMGDVAMLVPIVERLHKTYPYLKISVLTKPFFVNLFSHLEYVNKISAHVEGKHKGLVGLFKLSHELPEDIDAVADMHEVLRSKVIRTLLGWRGKKIAKINKHRKLKKQLTTLQPKKIHPLPSVFEAYAGVLKQLNLPINLDQTTLSPQLAVSSETINKLNISKLKLAIGFAPFAAHQAKVLPLEKSKELLIKLSQKINREVLLFGGGEKEIEQLNKLAEGLDNVVVVAGKISFSEELALISQLSLMISMDSGNGHLAAMFQVPVITIWGATHPYAGFSPFMQPVENQFTPDLAEFPLLPTSIYGNKKVAGYEDVMNSLNVSALVKRAEDIINENE